MNATHREFLIALCSAILLSAFGISVTKAQGNDLIGYDRYKTPYLNVEKIRSMLGEKLYQEFRTEIRRDIQACRATHEPIIKKLYVPGYAYHLQAEDALRKCENDVVLAGAAKVPQMALGKGDTGASSDWFTCASGPVCVEYLIDDPSDRQRFIEQCANHRVGPNCSKDGRRCEQKAPGRKSITYGGDVSNDEFRGACINAGGDYSCYGNFC